MIDQGYALVLNYEANSVYYLWDVLTTISSLFPETIETKKTKSDVQVEEPADWWTYPMKMNVKLRWSQKLMKIYFMWLWIS